MLGSGNPAEGRPAGEGLGIGLEGPPEGMLGLEGLGSELEGAPEELLGVWGEGICGCGNGVIGAQALSANRQHVVKGNLCTTISPQGVRS